MTYPIYGNHPQNLLVANQFNPESFQVVQQVYYSLEHLRVIYKHIGLISNFSHSIHRIEEVSKYLGDISNIKGSLNELLNLEYNIPFLQDIAPRVGQFVNELEDIQNKLCLFDTKFEDVLGLMETNTKHLEDLFVQYECGLKSTLESFKTELCETHSNNMKSQLQIYNDTQNMYAEIKDAVNRSNLNAEWCEDFRVLAEHLKASDLVTLAQFTGSEDDYEKALKQIKVSEKYGTNEVINRARLKYKLAENNVFNVLDANKERILKENKGNK